MNGQDWGGLWFTCLFGLSVIGLVAVIGNRQLARQERLDQGAALVRNAKQLASSVFTVVSLAICTQCGNPVLSPVSGDYMECGHCGNTQSKVTPQAGH